MQFALGGRASAALPGGRAGARRRCSGASRRGSVRCTAAQEQAAAADTAASTSGSGSAEPCIRLFYRTGWSRAALHGSLGGGGWRDWELSPVASSQGQWLAGRVELPPGAGAGAAAAGAGAAGPAQALLEFVVTDGKDTWDKPAAGGNYAVAAAGAYALRGGQLAAVPGRPLMLVSDLDGTMVGDDAATARFRDFWVEEAVTRGSLLVYNTGRSLDSFGALQREKAHCLAQPDVLISAVGTRIYVHRAGGWAPDAEWGRLLDRGWNVEVVREAAYSALAMVGKDRMHFRPPEEQNRHKITCGVAASVEDEVIRHINGHLFDGAVRANVIISGVGDWRFLDVVPIGAGKLEATEYVRRSHGFPLDATVSCGDSGNDILMLSGDSLGVVVGNAQPDLKAWAAARAASEPAAGPNGAPRLLVASRHEALGILEALERFGLK